MNKEECHKEAKKYNSRIIFRLHSGNAYYTASRNGWLNGVCSHIPLIRNQKGYWNKERCQEEALKFNNKMVFIKNCHYAYVASHKNGWMDEICSHMDKRKPSPYLKWSYEVCKTESLNYNNEFEFEKNSNKAYLKARKKGWINDFFPKN